MSFTNSYYVLSTESQKFGPADLSQLEIWLKEGRLTLGTQLEETATGRRILASEVLVSSVPSSGTPPVLPFRPAAPTLVQATAPTTIMSGRQRIFLCLIYAGCLLFFGWHFIALVFLHHPGFFIHSTHVRRRYLWLLLDMFPVIDLPIVVMFGYSLYQAARGQK